VAKRPTKRDEYKRKWLVVVDETEECDRALTFAGYRLRRTGGTIVLLNVIQPDEFQHWIGVENVMRAEAMRDAEKLLQDHRNRVAEIGDIRVETLIREGRPAEEIEALIGADKDIAILVLAAAASSEGPGPLVSAIASRGVNAYPIPVAIVPGNLTDDEIEALT
jgi:nucleotide-binding universal stress UspA family protein